MTRTIARPVSRIVRMLQVRYASQGRDRGDVPGWVLITVMTAGLVTALWVFAGPALTDIFGTAIKSVKGP
ncbi:MAG: hypothetical protein ABI083_15640 [Lapillicoccus sp.]